MVLSAEILKFIKEKQSVSVNELAKQFNNYSLFTLKNEVDFLLDNLWIEYKNKMYYPY
jgi:hypothetical protein